MTTCRFGPLLVEYDARVLRPRPWTLLQSTWAAELARTSEVGPILELCAGAGHIGLTAAVLSDSDLVQVEADDVAAKYAVVNAARAGWARRADVRSAPMAAALSRAERFPLVIADPPYLPSAEVSRWPQDPVTAIDGGADGLTLLGECLRVAAGHLTPRGRLLLQVAGPRQAGKVSARLAELGLVHCGSRVVDERRAVILIERATSDLLPPNRDRLGYAPAALGTAQVCTRAESVACS